MMRIIAYFRVSTDKQGRSGLGLAAQKRAIEDLCASRQGKIVKEFREVESGKRADNRPKLIDAIREAKITGATLVIAKIDRLSRNAAFLINLRDSGVKFVAADMPDANDLTIGILALVAQQEREAISRRTIDALAAAKRAGKRLGAPNAAIGPQQAFKGRQSSIIVRKARARHFATDLREVVDDIRLSGVATLQGIAAELTAREILTPRGGQWHASSVRNLLARIG